MKEIKYYYPYISNNKNKKYMIYTKDNKWVYFGQAGASDFTIHKDEKRKIKYLKRHEKNEDWNNIDTAATWSKWLLWEKPTLNEAYLNMKQKFNI